MTQAGNIQYKTELLIVCQKLRNFSKQNKTKTRTTTTTKNHNDGYMSKCHGRPPKELPVDKSGTILGLSVKIFFR